jgi:signal transduction histidine kinase
MKSISNKLIFTIISLLIIITIIDLSIQTKIAKQNIIETHKESLNRLFQRLQLTLSDPIWNMQTQMVGQIILTEGLDDSIDSIKVFDEENNLISQYLRSNPKQNIPQSKFININYNKQKIATVEISYNRDNVQKLIAQKIQNILIHNLIIILIISLIIKLVVDNIITKRLLNLTSNIKLFSTTKKIKNIKIKSNDEIGFLAHEFNNMQKELKQNWDSLNQINKTLEDKVKIEVEKNRKKEKQIFEQSKLAQMGEMIGNIAHQWRQPLSFISTIASSLSLQKELGTLNDEIFYERMQDIVNKTMYLSNTIDTFRDFIKNDKDLYTLSINKTVDETLQIIEKNLENENIEIKKNYHDELYYMGYKGEISQVLLNILNNAKDALLEKEIAYKQLSIDISKFNENSLCVTIIDNAGGIKEDILSKIFDPYFTTKHKSQGTGIGLYMSKDIIEKHHNGELRVENTKDGAKFTIILPLKK